MTNNVTPSNYASTISAGSGNFVAYLQHPYVSGVFPDQLDFIWDIAAGLPADDDDYGYIALAEITGTTVNQLVTGSLWGDRLKTGTDTARYYYAQV
jgi:hypothetical protein